MARISTWAKAIVQTHTDYFKLGWAVYSDLKLESGSASLRKSLDFMQDFVDINEDDLRKEYESLLQYMAILTAPAPGKNTICY